MLISLSKRFVFISNSKTASTSFEKVLDPYAEIRLRGTGKRKHAVWSTVREEFHFLFDHPDYRPESFFRFGIVRDPVEWFVSWYNYRMREAASGGLPPGTTFEQYWRMDDWTKVSKGGVPHLQKNHFTDADGNCTFDLVMPMDMLKQYEAQLFARVGVRERLPVRNKSPKMFSSKQISPELAAEIREFWHEDYAFIEAMRERVRSVLAAPVAAAPRAGLRIEPVEGVEKVRIQLVTADPENNQVSLRGSVICAPTMSADAGLFVRATGQRVAVQWQQPSPALATKHPDNPRAAHARFSSEAFVLADRDKAELYLEIPGRGEQLIGAVDGPESP